MLKTGIPSPAINSPAALMGAGDTVQYANLILVSA
jgi:hypothetical protein